MRSVCGFGQRRPAWAAILLCALLPGVAAGQPAPEQTLRIVLNADLAVLDPIVTTAGVTSTHAQMVYDQLFGRDAGLIPQPQMVERHEVSPDGLVWRFTLREDLAFHDGAPVTGADVVTSLRRWGARDPHGQQLMRITESLTAESDGRSMTWRLRRPYGLMLEALSKPAGNMPAIMPARVAAGDPFKPVQDTTGSGPFVFVREAWVPGGRAVYRRNAAYVPRGEPASGTAGGKRALVDQVEILSIANAQTAALALLKGEVDYLELSSVSL